MDSQERGPRRWPLALGAAVLAVGAALGLGTVAAWVTSLDQGAPAAGGARPQAPAPSDAPATAERHEGASSDGFTVWERNADGEPVRWDPCRPIELVLAADDWPAGVRADLQRAIAELGVVSGLDLEVVGETDERPAGARLPYQPGRYGQRWAPVLVAWASPGEDGLPLRDTDRGVALPVAVGAAGERTYVSGQVVLNAERDDLEAGFADRDGSWGATLLHELAHLVGLGHVEDPEELMHTYPGKGPVELGPGDRRGLRAVGADHGCRPVPDAGPVEVRSSERSVTRRHRGQPPRR